MKFHGRAIDQKLRQMYRESAGGINISKGLGISPNNLLMVISEPFGQFNLALMIQSLSSRYFFSPKQG
jgi:hypothetical protein